MTIGLSTYSFFWQWHQTAPKPLSLIDIIAKTADWDAQLLQICDFPAIEGFSHDEVRQLAATAERRGLALELRTRGIGPTHLRRYLKLARHLGVVRSMITKEQTPTAVELLGKVVSEYEKAGVILALETYERSPPPAWSRSSKRSTRPHWGSASTRPTASPRWRHPAAPSTSPPTTSETCT
jgi:hypothetical protein